MNDTYGSTAYFDNQSDARLAADALRAQGMDVDVRSSDSHGESFWDSIKNFFSGEKNDERYTTGAVLVIEGGDRTTLEPIVRQYNGTLSGGSTSTVGQTDYGSTATSVTGDVDYAGGMRDDMATANSRTPSARNRDLAEADLVDEDDRTL